MRPLLLAAPLSVLALACSNTSQTGTIPEQLEAVAVLPTGGSFDAISASGDLAVTAEGRDFTLTITPAAGPAVEISVHSPTTNLAKLDGLTVDADVSQSGLHEERSLVISDDGGVVYAADVGQFNDTIVAAFGADFATWGATVATDSDELYDWTYTSAKFQTDDGPVEILPGNAKTVVIAGDTYRIGVIAAYEVEAHPDAALPCGGISDLLSFEMLRIAEAEEPATVTRAAGADLAHNGCF